MFNVCPGCGEYNVEKEISGSSATCPQCHSSREFRKLPLYVVTGASGSGKTTVALHLSQTLSSHIVLDQDILWCDAFNDPANSYSTFRNLWLRLIKNINQAGRPVVLFGSTVPDQFEQCVERRYIEIIHYMALVCDDAALEQRLKQRPGWRKSGSDENIKRMLGFNGWLRANAVSTSPAMTLLDTTSETVPQTAKAIVDWLTCS